jgi:nicotinamide-nucleotide amidase
MPERNTIQAMFPAGSEPIENPHGTAPGIWFELPRPDGSICRIAAMPGVPSEMKPMFRERVLPRLPHSDKVIRRARVNCYGVGESACEEQLGDVTARGRDPEVGITVHEGTITLRIEAHGASESECDAKIARDKQLIRERLETLVFGEEDEQLEDVVVRELNRRGKTVSIADEVTGGVLSCWLTAAAQSEQCFVGGLIVGHVSNVPRPLLSGHVENVPHEKLLTDTAARARSLAESTRLQFGSDFALSIAGSLKMSGNADEIPRLYLALADASGTEVQEHIPVADVSFARNRAAKSALDLLRLRIA